MHTASEKNVCEDSQRQCAQHGMKPIQTNSGCLHLALGYATEWPYWKNMKYTDCTSGWFELQRFNTSSPITMAKLYAKQQNLHDP